MTYRRRRRKPRAPATLHTYEVSFTYFGYELAHETLRIRCRKLTPKQLRAGTALVGEVARQLSNGKFTPYGYGCVDGSADGAMRTVREIVETPIALAVNNEGDKK